MKDTVLTENEKKLISQIVTDERTGKYLLKKKQQEGYMEMLEEIKKICKTGKAVTERQKDIMEYFRQCSDCFYYLSLPAEKCLYI